MEGQGKRGTVRYQRVWPSGVLSLEPCIQFWFINIPGNVLIPNCLKVIGFGVRSKKEITWNQSWVLGFGGSGPGVYTLLVTDCTCMTEVPVKRGRL